MRKVLTLVACSILFAGVSALQADEKGKKVTIEGDGLCAKCALKEADECQNAVIVTKDGKKTTYYLEKNEFFKDAHQGLKICQAKKDKPVKVKVTGTCVEKDGKKILTPTEKITKSEG
jgi:Family of unknown function (DUF6370)